MHRELKRLSGVKSGPGRQALSDLCTRSLNTWPLRRDIMRILWEDGVIEIKSIYIIEAKGKEEILVEYWENYYNNKEDGYFIFHINKSCFKNGTKDFPAFVKKVRRDMLEKGFFDFDQDYSKMNLEKG